MFLVSPTVVGSSFSPTFSPTSFSPTISLLQPTFNPSSTVFNSNGRNNINLEFTLNNNKLHLSPYLTEDSPLFTPTLVDLSTPNNVINQSINDTVNSTRDITTVSIGFVPKENVSVFQVELPYSLSSGDSKIGFVELFLQTKEQKTQLESDKKDEVSPNALTQYNTNKRFIINHPKLDHLKQNAYSLYYWAQGEVRPNTTIKVEPRDSNKTAVRVNQVLKKDREYFLVLNVEQLTYSPLKLKYTLKLIQ